MNQEENNAQADTNDKAEDTPKTTDKSRDRNKPRGGLSALQIVALCTIILALGMFLYSKFGPKPKPSDPVVPPAVMLPDGPLEPMAIDATGPHVWDDNGKQYRPRFTYWLEVPEGLLYVIEHKSPTPIPETLTMRQAGIGVFPLVKAAYEAELYKRPEGEKQPVAIAVMLIDATGPKIKRFPVSMNIDKLGEQIKLMAEATTQPSLLAATQPRALESLSPAAQEFFPVLMKLMQDKTLLTNEGIATAGEHLPAMLALTDDDMSGIQNQKLLPFVAISSQLAQKPNHRQYVGKHFDEIANWQIRLVWAANLYAIKEVSPAVLDCLKTADGIPEQKALLKKMFGEKYDAVMQSLKQPRLLPTTAPVAEPAK